MTRSDPRIEMTLEFARGARQPTSSDRARHLSALEARLGPLGPLGSSLVAPLERAGVATPLGAQSAALLPDAAGWSLAALKWKFAGLAVLTASVGFWVGLGLGQQVSAARAVPAQQGIGPAIGAGASTEQSGAVQPSTAPPNALSSSTPPRSAEPPAAPPLAVLDGARQPLSSPSRMPAVRPRARHQQKEVATLRTEPARTDRSFLEALRIVQRAQRALDTGDADFAMSLLDELDARFAPRLLGEERQVTRALGWCALGDEARARSIGLAVLQNNPDSIYTGRLQRSCVHEGALQQPGVH